MAYVPRSEFDDVLFPALLSGGRANTMAAVAQLLESQWWSPDRLRECQLKQVERLVTFAHRLPHVRAAAEHAGWSPGEALTDAMWDRWPVLERDAAQSLGSKLFATPPDSHGAVVEDATSGSTGRPLVIRKTYLFQFMYQAASLRELLWAGRDVTQRYALIKAVPGVDTSYPDGARTDDWGGSAATIFDTGPGFVLDIRTPIEQAAEWVKRVSPGYLNTFPSMVDGIVDVFADQGWPAPPVKSVRTQGEVVSAALRAKVQAAWGAPIVDCYSAEEVGFIAFQSPTDETKLLAAAETTLVEVLDDDGRPCKPGEVGRVVVTSLHNFAMPLIRYAIGDYAKVGEPSACGRGLAVIDRVLGRSRSRLTLPDGSRRFAYNPSDIFAGIAVVRQYQIVQTATDRLAVRLVASRKLNENEARLIETGLAESFGYAFTIDWQYVDAIERTPGGKFEDIRSEIA